MFVLYHIGIKDARIQYGCHIQDTKEEAVRILEMYAPTQILFSAGLEIERKEDLPNEKKIKTNLNLIREKLKLKWSPK